MKRSRTVGDDLSNNLIPDINAVRQSRNLYTYALNNPIRYYDPSGENIGNIVFGASQAFDENNFGGAVGWLVRKYTSRGCRDIDSMYDYYLGRVIGDALSLLMSAGITASGITEIFGTILLGGGITVLSDGTLVAEGMTILVTGITAGTAQIAYGGVVFEATSKNLGNDYKKMKKEKEKLTKGGSKSKQMKTNLQFFAEKGGSGTTKGTSADDIVKYANNSKKIDGLSGTNVDVKTAMKAGEKFVGKGYKTTMENGMIKYTSKDGAKSFRIMTKKMKGVYEANFEIFDTSGKKLSNYHVGIVEN